MRAFSDGAHAIPKDPDIEKAVWNGKNVFDRIGCASCHIPELPLADKGWIFNEPNPYNPPLNLGPGTTKTIEMDLNSALLPLPRLRPQPNDPDVVMLPGHTDLKLHDITDPSESGEPLDQNQTPLDAQVPRGDRRFLTKRLWGCANEPPYFHHGLFTTMRQAVLAHAGEALATRRAFEKLNEYDQTPHLVVDEKFQPKKWPPSRVGRSANQGKGEDH